MNTGAVEAAADGELFWRGKWNKQLYPYVSYKINIFKIAVLLFTDIKVKQ